MKEEEEEEEERHFVPLAYIHNALGWESQRYGNRQTFEEKKFSSTTLEYAFQKDRKANLDQNVEKYRYSIGEF